MQISIGAKLKSLRTASGLSVEQVIGKLKERNIVISNKTLYGYENNIPIRSSVFLALCEIYGVSDILNTFLDTIPPASYEWYPSNYDDYFNGRTVNEKYEILSANGIPDFKGYEQRCTSDIFFGNRVMCESPSLSEQERQLLFSYRNLNDDGQEILLDYAKYLASSGKYIKSNPSDLGQKQA